MVQIQMVDTGAKTKKSGNGLAGNTYNAARAVMAVGTLGLSNLVLPKAKGKSKTTIKSQKMGICQNCGNSWTIK